MSQINPVTTLTKIGKFKQKICYNSAYARDMSSLCRWNIQNLHPTGDINEYTLSAKPVSRGVHTAYDVVQRRMRTDVRRRSHSSVVVRRRTTT